MLLSEITNKPQYHIPDNAIHRVTDECRPFLQMIDYDLNRRALYRGISDNALTRARKNAISDKIFIVPGHYENRAAMGTPGHIHKGLNQIFTQKFGAPMRNGLATTGSRSNASAFAESENHICKIIPIGDFKFCWSPNIDDLGSKFFMYYGNFDEMPSAESLADQFINTDLKEAIQSGNEVSIYCDRCIIILP